MSSIVFLNGDFCKEEDAKVSVFDRGYLFGDGIYEVVPVINGKVIDKAPFFERFDGRINGDRLLFKFFTLHVKI